MSSSKANATPQAGQGRPLPKKELDQFQTLVKSYEFKQYKKALKLADSILKKYADHGETLAMKGLVLNAMPGKDKDEAREFVKLGLRNDMRSHVCWHVYGLLHRAERNYNEAIKAYKQALRIEPENLQILRDLSLLQIQMRDLNGFLVTRQSILQFKSNQKINWLSFALAKHLNGDKQGAIQVLKTYLDNLHPNAEENTRCYETSELLMYMNSIMSEIPDNENETLKHLEDIQSLVVDQTSWLYKKGSTLLSKGDFSQAEFDFQTLLVDGSSENYRFHTVLMCAILQLDKNTCDNAMKLRGTDTVATTIPLHDVQRKKLIDHYENNLKTVLPRSSAVQRILLTLLRGDKLRDAFDSYCRKDIVKGAPFLGTDVSSLFLTEIEAGNGKKSIVRVRDPIEVRENDMFKLAVNLADGYIASLSQTPSKFPGSNVEESPSSLLWAWYFRAQLFEFSGDLKDALQLIEQCLDHTPTCVDIYERKARLLKLSGDIEAAADCVDKARELDKQDRYINNKTTKYLLRANRDEAALDRISLFTRHEGNPSQNLYDMQCIWYELEAAACFARQKRWGASLKKYAAVEKHFEDINEDQFDFHSYCIRKVTLRSYMNVLRFEDGLWGQNSYCRAAEGLIKIYLHLYDNPNSTDKDSNEVDYSKMTAAERKKAKAIARKKKKAAEKAESESAEKKEPTSGKVNVDDDPNGENLLQCDHLMAAKKYVSTLVRNSPSRISTWIWQYEVAIRRDMYLMALQALFKMKGLDKEDPNLITRIVDFHLRIKPKIVADTLADQVASSEFSNLTDGKSVEDYLKRFVSRIRENPTKSNLPMRVAVAKAVAEMKIAPISDAAALITDGGMNILMANVKNCRDAITALEELGDEAIDEKSHWIKIVNQRYPIALKSDSNMKQ